MPNIRAQRWAWLAALAAPVLPAAMHDLVLHSALNGRDVAIKVYTPPGYETSSLRYPVVYNLHGGGGSPQRQWERTRATLEDAMNHQRVRPMIYVYANGLGDTLFLDYDSGAPKVESMIVKELIPFIDERFRTIASHEGRAIEGFSMGGYGALLIAFRRPQLFSSAVAYGAAMLDPELIRIGGEDGQFPSAAFVENNSPWWLLEKNKERIQEHLRIRMVCGDQDAKWYPGNVKLMERAGRFGVKVDWAPAAGVAHDTKGLYERAGLQSLKFIEQGFDERLGREEGAARDLFYYSALNQRDLLIKVYTPPGYEKGSERYPVVYNLHGAGGGSAQRQWSRARKTLKDAIETGKVRPVIYVFADGLGDTFFLDDSDGKVFAESTIIKELIPLIDSRYRTIAAREGRSIEGFSMGGGAALRIAIKHPEWFTAVVSYGAALIQSDSFQSGGPRASLAAAYRRDNPWRLAPAKAAEIREKLAIRMVCGELDGAGRGENGLYRLNVEFKEMLGRLGVPVDWISVPGVAHDTKGLYGRAGLESLKFLEKRFWR